MLWWWYHTQSIAFFKTMIANQGSIFYWYPAKMEICLSTTKFWKARAECMTLFCRISAFSNVLVRVYVHCMFVCVCVCVRDGHADIVVTRIDAYVGYIRHISDIVRYCRIMRKLMRISASAWPSLVCVRCDVLSSTVTLIVVISNGLPNHEKKQII